MSYLIILVNVLSENAVINHYNIHLPLTYLLTGYVILHRLEEKANYKTKQFEYFISFKSINLLHWLYVIVPAYWRGFINRVWHIATIQIRSNNILPMVPTWRRRPSARPARRGAAHAQAQWLTASWGQEHAAPTAYLMSLACAARHGRQRNLQLLCICYGLKIRDLSCNSQCPQFHMVSLWLMAIDERNTQFTSIYLHAKYHLHYAMREIWIDIDHKTR